MPAALTAAGARVELHRTHFPDDCPDDVWLVDVGRRGWVVLTKDDRIRRHPLEINAHIRGKVRTFVFTGGNVSGPHCASILAGHLPRMTQLAREHPAPLIALVSKTTVRVSDRFSKA